MSNSTTGGVWCNICQAIIHDQLHAHGANDARSEIVLDYETMSAQIFALKSDLQAARAECEKMQQDFERKEPRLYKLKQELRYLREVELLFGQRAQRESELRAEVERLIDVATMNGVMANDLADKLRRTEAALEVAKGALKVNDQLFDCIAEFDDMKYCGEHLDSAVSATSKALAEIEKALKNEK